MNTIFNVPEGFFEEAEGKILKKAKRVRMHWITTFCTCVIVVAGIFWTTSLKQTESELPAYQTDLLADTNCDIFLEIFEY